ncbi:mycofactocin-coupled SDR family oxidoreductase [Mycolicibacterium smegmatis]|uniref:Carveol dehydrogenase n=1 Tax=Mycolicibacterium smegmatis (strain MKD8) TaxID=1214915 RepID=A0A2U9PIG1_MYCSE|nr:mycofactocin-coupled SDR family oxidoreductase [Mycolicibacterium smegmatis]AWT51468.1 carveol dehydrogenase [Mycolicibacterium smegmatis MKD8]
METTNLEGKVALVTGAARGQGRSHALTLASAGASLAILDLDRSVDDVAYPMGDITELWETQRQVEAHGVKCIAAAVDVRDSAQVDQFTADVANSLGGIDICVANAGVTIIAEALQTTDTTWAETLAVNLTGVFNTIRASARAMVEQGKPGSIICTGSVCSQRAQRGLTAYTASKHGVLGLVRQFALELAPFGVRVNIVEPGNTDTPMINNSPMYQRLRPDLSAPDRSDAMAAFQRMNVMSTPWVDPQDISQAVLWLASEQSRYVTGIELPVDAGLLLTPGLTPE